MRSPWGSVSPQSLDASLTSILTVCKQLNKEGLEIFYKTNTFSFQDPSSFNIFTSRLSSTRASLLRKTEFFAQDDNETLGSLIKRGPLAAPPYFWRLGVNDLTVSSKLTNITNVVIFMWSKALCTWGVDWDFVRAHRVSHIHRWLRYVFGGLCAMGSIRRMQIWMLCREERTYFTREHRWGNDKLGPATLNNIEEEFTKKVLDNEGGST